MFSNWPLDKRLLADEHWLILVAKEGDHKYLLEVEEPVHISNRVFIAPKD